MASYAYGLWGNVTPVLKQYQVLATMITGQFTIVSATGGNIDDATTTSAADGAGVTDGSATYTTTQGDTLGVVDVHSSPMAIFRALLTQGATNNTALTTFEEDSGETNGLVLTDSDLPSASMDQGTIWRVNGGEGGEHRTITSVSASTSVTVTEPFTNDIEVGDTFHVIPFSQVQGTAAQLSTTLDQIDTSIAAGTGAELTCYDLEMNGSTNSYGLFIHGDHVFNKA